MVGTAPQNAFFETESFGRQGGKRETPAEQSPNAKRRETHLSAILVNGIVGQFRGRMKSSPGRTRTYDLAVNSRSLYQLSYRGSLFQFNPKCIGRLGQVTLMPAAVPRSVPVMTVAGKIRPRGPFHSPSCVTCPVDQSC